ncbi:MAG: hypothetical protein GY924_22035 [Planctomycetaceae bacterium]|nr:hypothetical protein [Planctomycetaceae bacterium]
MIFVSAINGHGARLEFTSLEGWEYGDPLDIPAGVLPEELIPSTMAEVETVLITKLLQNQDIAS